MKKAILIIFILSIIFLTSCSGIFNLNGWICPDDLEFIVLIEELDTPQKISTYMIDNFIYEKHDFWTPNPYFLWKRGKGDCNDFATFGIFVANYHGYETYSIIISYNNTSTKHMIAVYVEDDGMSFSDNKINSCFLSKHYFDSFKEIVYYDWRYHLANVFSGYVVYDYWDNVVKEWVK